MKFRYRQNAKRHIFRAAKGHVRDTPEHRKLIEDVAVDIRCRIGTDGFGNTIHAHLLADGRQVWVHLRNGMIYNGGINDEPRLARDLVGLKGTLNAKQNDAG